MRDGVIGRECVALAVMRASEVAQRVTVLWLTVSCRVGAGNVCNQSMISRSVRVVVSAALGVREGVTCPPVET